MRSILLLVALLCFGTGSFAQIMKQRLIARATYKNYGAGMEAYDSTSFTYSGSRGSQFDYNIMDYFNPGYQFYQEMEPALSSIVTPNNIDAGYFSMPVRFDSMKHFNGGASLPEGTISIEYNPDGKPRKARRSSWYMPTDIFEYQYYYGELVRITRIVLDTTNTYNERFVIRDAYGDAVLDSILTLKSGKVQGSAAIHYEFDSLHRYTKYYADTFAGGINPNYTYSFTYYPDGSVHTKSISSGTDYNIDSFYYMPGVPGYVRSSVTSNFGFGWATTSHINAAGLKDTVTTVSVWAGGASDSTIVVVEYNTYNNPLSRTAFHYMHGYLAHTEAVYFYYEFYDASLGIGQSGEASSAHITLSPNPTTGTITLHHPASMDRLQVTITNSLGQLIYSESFIPQGTSTNITLDNEVAPGIYYISVSGESENTRYRSSFLKQ